MEVLSDPEVQKEVGSTAVEELTPLGIANAGSGFLFGYDVIRGEEVSGFWGRGLSGVAMLPGVPSAIRMGEDVPWFLRWIRKIRRRTPEPPRRLPNYDSYGGEYLDEGLRFDELPVPPKRATRAVDDLLQGGRQVRGRFPRTAGAHEVLLRRDIAGNVTHYQVFDDQGLPLYRVDVTGSAHGDVPTPHVLEFERHTNPDTSEVFVKPGDVRPARPEEVP